MNEVVIFVMFVMTLIIVGIIIFSEYSGSDQTKNNKYFRFTKSLSEFREEGNLKYHFRFREQSPKDLFEEFKFERIHENNVIIMKEGNYIIKSGNKFTIDKKVSLVIVVDENMEVRHFSDDEFSSPVPIYKDQIVQFFEIINDDNRAKVLAKLKRAINEDVIVEMNRLSYHSPDIEKRIETRIKRNYPIAELRDKYPECFI